VAPSLPARTATTTGGSGDRQIPPLGAPYARQPLIATPMSNGRSRAARGFRAGIGKTALVVIIIVVVIGALIGFSAARRFRRCR
jgi:hypothetical protein